MDRRRLLFAMAPVVLLALAGAWYAGLRQGEGRPPSNVGTSAEATLAAARGGGNARARDALLQAHRGKVWVVKEGQSIQEAILRAQPGDTVQLMPGTYHETTYIDKDDISLVGVIRGDAWPTLDGEGKRNDAVLYSGNGIRVENLKIVGYKGNAIMGQAGNNFVIRHNWIANTGVYGIFPELGKNGLVEHNTLTGIEDAAIYVGMCDNVHVAHNEVYGNVAGIEVENSRHVIVEDNMVSDNAGGILTFVTPGLPIKTAYDVIIRDNFVVANNHRNFAAVGSIVSGVPSGSGVIVMAADDVIVENNVIRGNKNAGMIIADHQSFPNVTPEPESDPYPDRVQILRNFFAENGTEPIPQLRALMLAALMREGPDVVAVGGGHDSCAVDKTAFKSIGLKDYGTCRRTSSADVATYLLDQPAEPRRMEITDKGKLLYAGICSGCHAYNLRMIGPPVQVIQALYPDNAQGIADYIANPVKKREDFPPMPPQSHLSPEMRLAVAQYLLSVQK